MVFKYGLYNFNMIVFTMVNVYRIAQVDFDGRTMYSVLRNVRMTEKKTTFDLLVNPVVNNLLSLRINNEGYFTLISADGKNIWHKKLGAGPQFIPLSGLPKGMYIIKSENQSKRFLIQ